MLSFGLGPRILLAPQPDGPSGGGYQTRGASDPEVRAFSHSRALPLEEALEVILVESLRRYLTSLDEPGLLPEFCLRHETLRSFIRDRPGFNQLTKRSWADDDAPVALLGAVCSAQMDALGDGGFLEAVRSSLSKLSLQVGSPSAGHERKTPEEFESVLVKRVEKFFGSFFGRFLKSWSPVQDPRPFSARWFDSDNVETFCSAIQKELGKPRSVALQLLGKSKHFEVMNALSEEQTLSCAELLVDYAVVEELSALDTEWVQGEHVRLVNYRAQGPTGDELFAAISSSWEARRCACRELVVMSAEEFFGRFPAFAEFERPTLEHVRVVILPSIDTEIPARLYAFRLPFEQEVLPDRLVRDLEWVAFKYGAAFHRIQARAHDEA